MQVFACVQELVLIQIACVRLCVMQVFACVQELVLIQIACVCVCDAGVCQHAGTAED